MLKVLWNVRPVCASLGRHFSSIGAQPSTWELQESLPRLPIPDLDDTCARYLSSQLPLLDDQEFAHTLAIVQKFRQGIGAELHSKLTAWDATLDRRYSYIHQAWKDMYQCDRGSVLLNQNPVLTYRDDPAQSTQLERATNMVTSTLRYFCSLRDGKLAPINSCMMQFPNLFQSTRVPGESRDSLVRYPDAKNLVVLHKGHAYSLEVLDGAGMPADSGALEHALQQILADDRPVNELGLGYFTALGRTEWATERAKLIQENREMLETIDKAIFVLCLDDLDANTPEEALQNGLVGEGYNRWMDKSFSLIVTKNGKASINWEHSWGDGATIIHMMQEVYKDSLRHMTVNSDAPVPVQKLHPRLNDSSAAALGQAKQQFENARAGYDLRGFSFEGFGKSSIKKFGVSPDSLSQLIFQMAQWRTYGKLVGTYESASTAGFRSGRTETIRSCTSEMKNCAVAFDTEHPATLSEMVDLLKANSVKHATLCREAVQGYGWDRHLFALRNLNKLEGESELDLFTDANYSKVSTIGLSTSTVADPCLQLYLAFGAVSPNGYGLGYLMSPDQFGAAVSCYTPNEYYSDFLSNLESTCSDLHAVMLGKNFKESRTV